MLKKGSKLHSILTGSCPRCQEESMYLNKNPYILGKLYAMNENCSRCGLKYKIEPSFFYGAMYVSYGLTVAIGIAIFIVASFFGKLTANQALFYIILGILFLMPITARLARNIYINLFVKFNSDWKSISDSV